MSDDDAALRDGYSRVAAAYAVRFGDELAHKPLDRALIAIVLADRPRGSTVADVGCGPGHVTQHVHDSGAPVVGVDIAPGMLAEARRLHPGIEFREASLTDLRVADGGWGAILALYSIIHLRDDELEPALHECARALAPDGRLLLSFHVGDHVAHRDEFLGESVSLDFHLLQPDDVGRACRAAGLEILVALTRAPYEPVEGPTTRGYVLARKP